MKLLIHSQTSTLQTVNVWEWISKFIPHGIMDLITYQCCDLSQSMFVNGAPGQQVIRHRRRIRFLDQNIAVQFEY